MAAHVEPLGREDCSDVLSLSPQHAVQVVWQAIRDLIEPSQPTDVRHTALFFTKALISGQVSDAIGVCIVL